MAPQPEQLHPTGLLDEQQPIAESLSPLQTGSEHAHITAWHQKENRHRTTAHICDNLLVGISGAIRSIQIHTYLYQFRREFARRIKVIMTKAAQQMVNPATLEFFTDDRVFVDLWDTSPAVKGPHVQLPRWADLFIVIPATANIIGKAANGIADDLLSTAIQASPRPIIFAPSMNPVMWASKAVQRNVELLKQDGHYIIPPTIGVSVTSGEWDQGLGPSLKTVLLHLKHVMMQRLKDEYWEEATREKPRTPIAAKLAKIETGNVKCE